MSLRPFRDIKRRKTKVINVGNVKIGGDNPISVQSMTNTLTTDVKATIKQINDIAEEGADIVRVSCPDEDSSKALIFFEASAWNILYVIPGVVIIPTPMIETLETPLSKDNFLKDIFLFFLINFSVFFKSSAFIVNVRSVSFPSS